MDRLACVDLPAFPLQILLHEHPDWAGWPAAVVDRESPQGEILVSNERARQKGILPGFRYGPALALAPSLRAGTISQEQLDRGVNEIFSRLMRFTPEVEPIKDQPGSFYLKATGLWRLHRSPEHWAEAIRANLKSIGYLAYIVVGFSRFGTQALARSHRHTVWVQSSPDEESGHTRQVRLDRLSLGPKNRDLLLKLGIKNIGDLLDLPADGLLERFGPELFHLHEMARGQMWQGMEAALPKEPITAHVNLDEPEKNTIRLTFLVKRLLSGLLTELATRHLALFELKITMKLDRTADLQLRLLEESVKPAAPTLDEVQISDLVRLKIESLRLESGVIELTLEGIGLPAEVEQLLLFAEAHRRDLDAANRALARLRAEFGEHAVHKATLRAGHLPEAHFVAEPMGKLAYPNTQAQPHKSLVRRLFSKPLPLQPRPVVGPRGCHLTGMDNEPFSHLTGPYVISGGWWAREVHREYYFAHGDTGRILWVYFDKMRRSWFVHGVVE